MFCCCPTSKNICKNNNDLCKKDKQYNINTDEVTGKKKRIGFDLNSIIKANTIKKATDLNNQDEKIKIKICNKKLSYLTIIENLQIDIDKLINNIIINMNKLKDNNLKSNIRRENNSSKLSESQTENKINIKNISNDNIYLKHLLSHKIKLRNDNILLLKKIINYEENEYNRIKNYLNITNSINMKKNDNINYILEECDSKINDVVNNDYNNKNEESIIDNI